jgi:ammonia channel protein AmtB
MQLGFAFLEAGNLRIKHVTNMLMKVVLDGLLASLGWWAIGFAFAFGDRHGYVRTQFSFTHRSGKWIYWHQVLLCYRIA